MLRNKEEMKLQEEYMGFAHYAAHVIGNFYSEAVRRVGEDWKASPLKDMFVQSAMAHFREIWEEEKTPERLRLGLNAMLQERLSVDIEAPGMSLAVDKFMEKWHAVYKKTAEEEVAFYLKDSPMEKTMIPWTEAVDDAEKDRRKIILEEENFDIWTRIDGMEIANTLVYELTSEELLKALRCMILPVPSGSETE